MVLLLNTSKGNRQIENNGNLIFLFNKDFQKGYQFTGGPSSRIDTLSISSFNRLIGCESVEGLNSLFKPFRLGCALCTILLNNSFYFKIFLIFTKINREIIRFLDF